MSKSLLMLLKREDELVRRVKFHKDTYEEVTVEQFIRQ